MNFHFISQFTNDIRHLAGQGNPVADALSQMEANAITLDPSTLVDFQALAKAQPENCKLCRQTITLSALLRLPCPCVLINFSVIRHSANVAPTYK